ncbi:MAG: macro domain-containing protein [Candidatus Thorarchaeota archaeon]|jgi:O-acetyl-ADP-ribose deacetylase (regulator of RNase III)
MEKRLGEILVKTYLGDITDLAVDVIANAANSDLWMGTGVAGVIKDKGGTEIEKEAISLGPIRPLPGGKATYWKVLSSVQTALSIASTHNLESIAFPAIGAGVGGMKEEQSAKAITDGIYHYSKSPGSVKEITLVGFNKYVHDCFCKAVEDCQE